MAIQSQQLGGPLDAKIDRVEGATLVTLKGHINEATNLQPLQALPGPLRIDLAGVDRINSIGVRTWIVFVRECERAGATLTFERCSPAIVSQLGMISNFFGTRGRVKSLYLVYVCAKCHAERPELVEVARGSAPTVSPTAPCTKCKSTMQLDAVEQTYTKLFPKLADNG